MNKIYLNHTKRNVYEELLNMKNDLRSYNWIINSITALVESKLADIDLVKMM